MITTRILTNPSPTSQANLGNSNLINKKSTYFNESGNKEIVKYDIIYGVMRNLNKIENPLTKPTFLHNFKESFLNNLKKSFTEKQLFKSNTDLKDTPYGLKQVKENEKIYYTGKIYKPEESDIDFKNGLTEFTCETLFSCICRISIIYKLSINEDEVNNLLEKSFDTNLSKHKELWQKTKTRFKPEYLGEPTKEEQNRLLPEQSKQILAAQYDLYSTRYQYDLRTHHAHVIKRFNEFVKPNAVNLMSSKLEGDFIKFLSYHDIGKFTSAKTAETSDPAKAFGNFTFPPFIEVAICDFNGSHSS